jgi:hypothetical protein
MMHVIVRKQTQSQAWWCTPVILAFRRLRQEDQELEVNLGYLVRSCLKKTTKQAQSLDA